MRFSKNFVKCFRPALYVSVFARNIIWITLKETIYHNYLSKKKTEITDVFITLTLHAPILDNEKI